MNRLLWIIPILVLFILSCTAGCSENNTGPKAVTDEYNNAFNSGDSDAINDLLVPTLSFSPEMLGQEMCDVYRDPDRIIEVRNRGCDISKNPDSCAGTHDATCYITGYVSGPSDASGKDCIVMLEMDLIGDEWKISKIGYVIPQ